MDPISLKPSFSSTLIRTFPCVPFLVSVDILPMSFVTDLLPRSFGWYCSAYSIGFNEDPVMLSVVPVNSSITSPSSLPPIIFSVVPLI